MTAKREQRCCGRRQRCSGLQRHCVRRGRASAGRKARQAVAQAGVSVGGCGRADSATEAIQRLDALACEIGTSNGNQTIDVF
jgi:hypothetical protein